MKLKNSYSDAKIASSRVAFARQGFEGRVTIPPSKSYLHRILICAFLSENEVVIEGKSACADVQATVSCLNSLGADIQETDDGYRVRGGAAAFSEKQNKEIVLDCNESGSTLRFLLPLAASLGGGITLSGSYRLGERPNAALIKELNRHGADISLTFPFVIKGKLRSGDYVLPGNISSQYITGLLLTLPLLEGDSSLTVTTEILSAPYVDITLEVLEMFGVKIQKDGNKFLINGAQKYTRAEPVFAEGDWSSASFWLVAGAVCGNIEIEGLNLDSKQGDKRVLQIIKDAGGCVEIMKEENREFIRVKSGAIKPFEVDINEIPDTAPALAVLAIAARGRCVLRGAERLKDKECDRLAALIENLKRLGVKAFTETGKELVVDSKRIYKRKYNIELFGRNDHRIVMSAAIATAAIDNAVVVTDEDAVNKSYPEFWEDFRNLTVPIGDLFI
ncbi:MAG: 3-phosphoshikimate 1-carboxyvinyltransferase [Christensenellaceae bacterium]|jgi:3-phosphoshikimate 1-carboxyvinyltransferase|nr:3-phosphoshikimate 1-carboxyvinyltransferase [Christensenellaceae bacterium]